MIGKEIFWGMLSYKVLKRKRIGEEVELIIWKLYFLIFIFFKFEDKKREYLYFLFLKGFI